MFHSIFGNAGIPHGFCFLWNPGLLWLHVVSDSLIALAYFLIPVALVRILRKRKDVPFNGIFICFAAFIVFCGITHVLEVVTLWRPIYWASGGMKLATAIISLATLVVLVRLTPKIVAIPGHAALDELNRRLSSVLDNTRVGIYAVDSEWTIRYINENAMRTLRHMGDVLGKNLWQSFPNLEEETVIHLRAVMESRVPAMFESYYEPLDLWTNVKVHPWEESGITVYFSDISERKRTERELARANQRLASVLDNTSIGIYAVDKDWIFTYVNENARELLKAMGDVMGKDLRSAFPDQRPSTRAMLEQVMATRQPVAFESYYAPLDFSTNISAHPLDDGGITIYFSDISAQRRLERELEAERAQRQQRIEVLAHLSSGLAHEIKNPLAIIHARASDLGELAEEGEVGRAEIGKACASIVQTSDRAIRILRGVAAMARVGTHDPMADADVAGMVRQAVELVEGRFRVAGIRLKTNVPANLPMLECREVQIGQILVNLLNNAFDAVDGDARSERWVRVQVTIQPGTQHENHIDRLQIAVIDGGPGVAPEHRERLMQTFFTTKSLGAGIGIGLSVSRKIAEDHGGQLELRESDGHTCFRLTLPIKVGQTEEVAA